MGRGEPLYLLDLVKMRGDLNIDARGSLRVILDPSPSGNLGIALECCACEELLEWCAQDAWWLCPECEREFTDREVEGLLVACAQAFQAGTEQDEGQDPEPEEQPEKDERTGIGRWVDRLRRWRPET